MKVPHFIRLAISCSLWVCGSCQGSNATVRPTVKPSASSKTMSPTVHPKWRGCVGNANYPTTIQKGLPTVVCMTMGPLGDWTAGASVRRFSFTPVADEYSKFTIPNSYRDLVQTKSEANFKGNLTVFVASQTSVSYLRLYHDVTQNYIYPHLTAIIDVSSGLVNGIVWDDACVFCKSNRCLENTYDFFGNMTMESTTPGVGPTKGCYFTTEECNDIIAKNGTECDLTLYVAWTGTDSLNKPLFSSSSRFSAFSQESVYNQLMGGLKKTLGSNFLSTILG